MLTLVLVVVIAALVFEYINGFHDTANSIATVVATKTLSPMQAVLLAAATNLFGALWGTAVAKTVASGIVDTHVVEVTSQLVLCALIGGIVWNLITWAVGLPSSSSHALIGGLCGAALAAARGNWHVDPMVGTEGPVVQERGRAVEGDRAHGDLTGAGLPRRLPDHGPAVRDHFRVRVERRLPAPRRAPASGQCVLRKAQVVSAAAMGFAHGSNDAQKTMGIIAIALVGAQSAGTLDALPTWLAFLHPSANAVEHKDIDTWIKVTCALVMCAGTAAGGWRIIKTLGHKLVKLQPINGFAAEASAATVILTASALGIPVSTTHNISATIMGVGTAKRSNAIRWTVVERMIWAWILTIPAAGGIAWLAYEALLRAGLA